MPSGTLVAACSISMAGMHTAYTQPLSLWKLVEQHVDSHEQDEVKDMLGNSLVEQSLELHAEIDMLLEIWRDIKEETNESSRPQSTLPEPPNQRDRLVQEICFFVDNVKEQAKRKGIDPEHILKRHNSEILDYAADMARPGTARSRTSRSSDGRETPMAVLSPERLDLAYNMTDQVDAVNKQLNFMDFGEVCLSLRSYLEKEVEQLLEDVQFLQKCLDEAADTRDCPTPALSSREPTLTELREERSMLEKELFATEKMSATPAIYKPLFNTTNKVLPRTPPTPTSQRSPPVSPPPIRAASSKRVPSGPGPMKASHGRTIHSSQPDIITMSSPGYKKPTPSGSGSSINISPVSSHSSPSLDDEFFGLSSSAMRPGQDDENSARNGDLAEVQALINSKTTSHKQGLSKSGSCLGDEKSPLKTILPSPHAFPAPSHPSPTTTTVGNPQSCHSDSDLIHQPIPPSSLRPGTIVGGTGRVRRRTVSPRPRFRVVDVTNLVESHSGKGDSDVPCRAAERVVGFASPCSSSMSSHVSPSSSSAAMTSISPSSPDVLSDREHRIRPGSANRFREMVLECREGQ